MKTETERKFLTIDDIQREYLPISHKKIRAWVKENLPVKHIGRRRVWVYSHSETLPSPPLTGIYRYFLIVVTITT